MKYSCGIIKDLLPLYIDDAASGESRDAVAKHLLECGECRQYFEAIKADASFADGKKNKTDAEIAGELKRIKKRFNRKKKIVIVSFIAAAAALFLLFQILFCIPLKTVDISDVAVTASVYRLDELEKSDQDENGVKISLGEEDTSDLVALKIPEIGEVNLSEDVIEKNGFATVISWKSPYFLREIKYDSEKNGKDTLYVTAFKTTVLNNKSEEYNQSVINFEIKEINKIVYLEKDGSEKVLWENEK